MQITRRDILKFFGIGVVVAPILTSALTPDSYSTDFEDSLDDSYYHEPVDSPWTFYVTAGRRITGPCWIYDVRVHNQSGVFSLTREGAEESFLKVNIGDRRANYFWIPQPDMEMCVPDGQRVIISAQTDAETVVYYRRKKGVHDLDGTPMELTEGDKEWQPISHDSIST